MKKLALAMMFGAAAVSANAQISSVQMQVACNPQDVKTYDTKIAQQLHDGKGHGR